MAPPLRCAPDSRTTESMRLVSLLAVPLLLATGCGIVSENLNGNLSVKFTVDSTDTDFVNELKVNPNEYQSVRDNCSSIEKETGQIRDITISVQTNEGHLAKYGWGELYMRGPVADAWPATPATSDLVAVFERVPLVDGQVITVELNAAQRAKIARLVFTENCDREVQLKMVGHADDTTNFAGEITIVADFIGKF